MRSVNINLEDTEYDELRRVLADMGMTLRTFYEALTKDFLNKRYEDIFYSESNIRRLEHSFRQAEEGKVIVKSMEELEAMAADSSQYINTGDTMITSELSLPAKVPLLSSLPLQHTPRHTSQPTALQQDSSLSPQTQSLIHYCPTDSQQQESPSACSVS